MPESSGEGLGVKRPRRNRGSIAPGLHRGAPKDDAPWLLRFLRDALPVGISVAFLAAGGVAAVLASDTAGGAWFALVAVLAALAGAAFLSERLAHWLLAYFD